PHVVCYSVKANSNLGVLSVLAKAGAGADIVSGGELYRALRAGVPPKKIIFSGVGKSRDEMREALKADILMFNVESRAEIRVLDIGGGLGIRYRDEKPPTHQEFATLLLPALREAGVTVLLEPGRSIVGNAGVLLTRVLYRKDTGAKKFVVVDGAMNDL